MIKQQIFLPIVDLDDSNSTSDYDTGAFGVVILL